MLNPVNLPIVAATIPDICRRFSVSRSTLYRAVARGEIIPKKIGHKTLIAVADADAWFNNLPNAKTA